MAHRPGHAHVAQQLFRDLSSVADDVSVRENDSRVGAEHSPAFLYGTHLAGVPIEVAVANPCGHRFPLHRRQAASMLPGAITDTSNMGLRSVALRPMRPALRRRSCTLSLSAPRPGSGG